MAVKGAIVVACLVFAVLMSIKSSQWQREIADLMGMAPVSDAGYPRTVLLGAVVVGLLIWISRSGGSAGPHWWRAR